MRPDPQPTREAGLARLAEFAPMAGRRYAERRGLDLSAQGHPHVSRLSPFLRHGMVGEEEVLRAAVATHGEAGAAKFVSEVGWRAYFKGFLEMRPAIWEGYRAGLARARDRLATEGGLRREWEAACGGDTGLAPLDAWARELREAGYLHNHARMWFASLWCFTLRLPWELGADLFMRHLLDGDPASNTLSWRWVGGLHTPGKLYLATGDNIARHTAGRFGPDLPIAQGAEPVEGMPNPPPAAPPRLRPWEPGRATGLLIHEDDLRPEPLLERFEPRAVAVLSTVRNRSPLAVAPHVADFAEAAAEDCARRLGLCPEGPFEAAEPVVAWARGAGLDLVATPHAPVGPAAALLGRIERGLAAHGIGLVRVLRPFDAAAWPHATRGYFRFKRALPGLVEAALAGRAAP